MRCGAWDEGFEKNKAGRKEIGEEKRQRVRRKRERKRAVEQREKETKMEREKPRNGGEVGCEKGEGSGGS